MKGKEPALLETLPWHGNKRSVAVRGVAEHCYVSAGTSFQIKGGGCFGTFH